MSSQIILPQDATLKGKDIAAAYLMAKTQPDPERFHMFKKKESVENMAKSLLKHKIQNLTGRTSSDIEEEMGYPSTREGGGIPVEVLRRLAHFLILQAVGQLEVPEGLKTEPVINKISENVAVRQGRRSLCPPSSPSPLANGTPKRSTRRSVAPELLRDTSVTERVVCRLKSEPNSSNQTTLQESQAEVAIPEEDLGLGDNPTPMMIALKRKSLAANTKPAAPKMEQRVPEETAKKTVSPKKKATRSLHISNGVTPSKVQKLITVVNTKEEDIPEITNRENKIPRMTPQTCSSPDITTRNPRFSLPTPPRSEFPGSEGCKIFLVNGDSKNLEYQDLLRVAPGFEGSNLTILHTPVEWDPVRLLTFVLEIKRINQKAKLESYLMLIGCGIPNAKLVQDALYRQTRHVQFVVFERADQGTENHIDGMKLREATSYFFLAYFFPGCQDEGSQPPEPMVRPGFSNCFHTKSIEDLENNILYALSEKGDWILDVFCRNREISLAAQKTGRNSIAIDPSHEMLLEVKEKAQAVACHHDPTFRSNVDGRIQTL